MKIGAFEFTEPLPLFEEPHVIAMLYLGSTPAVWVR